MQRTLRALKTEKSLDGLRFHYNISKDGDPPLQGAGEEEAVEGRPPLRCVMYKGQRKSMLRIREEVPVKEVVEFFTPRSEELTDEMKNLAVGRVTNHSFTEDVIAASDPARPILVQMYEDTCFLCFLMRPFINSLAVLFAEHNVPLVMKRLNIERNDFPDGCPVARGTPTFACFRGPDVPPSKWDEFKPRDLVEKISKVFPHHADALFEPMDELQGLVSKRFQFFTQLVMWTIELQKLERLVAEVHSAYGSSGMAVGPSNGPTDESSDAQEDSAFNTVVSDMMMLDMKRTDGMAENLKHLQNEVDDVEHDALLMGKMLAEAITQREDAERGMLGFAGTSLSDAGT